MALRKGVSKCEKKNKKRVDKGEPSTDKDQTASDAGKRGETEQMWEYILKSYKFQPCRTARDLKDKWRQLKKKEQDDLLGVREEARRLRMLAVGPGGGLHGGRQGNVHSGSGDAGSSTGSSNGQAGHSAYSPAESSSPSAGLSCNDSGAGGSPLPTAPTLERSGKPRAQTDADNMWDSGAAAGGAKAKQQGSNSSGSNGSAEGSDGSESGDVEGGSEGTAGGSEQGESVGSGEGGRGSEGSGDTGGESIMTGTDETGQTSTGNYSHSAGTSSSHDRSDSSPEGGSNDGRGEEGASDGSSNEWKDDDANAREEITCTDGKHKLQRPTLEHAPLAGGAASSRSRLPRAGTDQRSAAKRDASCCWALAIDLRRESVRVTLVNQHGELLAGVEAARSASTDSDASTFSAKEYFNLTCQALDDAMSALCKWNINHVNKPCRRSPQGGGSASSGVCACGKCKPPIAVRVVGMSCFTPSLVGLGDEGAAITPGLVLRECAPELSLASKAKKWVSLSAYILKRFTGSSDTFMTVSEASGSGLLDRNLLQWDQRLVARLGLTVDALPDLCDVDALHTQVCVCVCVCVCVRARACVHACVYWLTWGEVSASVSLSLSLYPRARTCVKRHSPPPHTHTAASSAKKKHTRRA